MDHPSRDVTEAQRAVQQGGAEVVATEQRLQECLSRGRRRAAREARAKLSTLYETQSELEMALARAVAEVEASGRHRDRPNPPPRRTMTLQ